MSFTTLPFLVLVALSVAAYYLLPQRVQWMALLAASNPIGVIFTGCFMSMLDIVGLQLTNLTAYNEYITDVKSVLFNKLMLQTDFVSPIRQDVLLFCQNISIRNDKVFPVI